LTDRGQTRHIAGTTRLTDAAGGTPADRPPLPPVCIVEVRVLDCPVVHGSRSEVQIVYIGIARHAALASKLCCPNVPMSQHGGVPGN